MSIKALWQILAILMAVLLMIMFPILNSFEKEDDFTRIQILDELDYFVSKIKQSGSISRRDYELFSSSLNKLGYPFEIKMNHYKEIYVPVYDNPSDYTSFNGEIKRVEELFTDQEIKDCLYPRKSDERGKTYYMKKGDYITVSVKSKVKSKYQKIRETFLNTSNNTFFYAKLGGLIQHEAY